MSVRNLSAAGLGMLAVGGPLLLVGIPAGTLGLAGSIGVAALWLGMLLVLVAILQLGRTEHRLLRAHGETTRTVLARLQSPTPSAEELSPALSRALDVRFAGGPPPEPNRLAGADEDVVAVEPPPGLAEARLVGLLDPAAELLRGALPYHDAAAELPDDQAVPTLRVRRRVAEPGLRVAVDGYRDDVSQGGEDVEVERLPLDRVTATPRRRVDPMPTEVLRLAGTDPTQGADDRDGRILRLPAGGPAAQDAHDVLHAARRHRLVVAEASIEGDPALLAGLVLQVVASGTVCWCPPQIVARLDLLSPELRDALTFDRDAVATDDLLLAARAAVQKRAAWADHDLRLNWQPADDGVWRPRLVTVPSPAVSVVLVSRRPHLVAIALAMIAAQREAELEVIVALHGGGDAAAVDGRLRSLGLEGRTLSVPATVPFGAVLNQAIARASSPLVLKWDDDDLYGPRHVQDLLIARRQSGAALVGKAAEFVYFDRSGQSIWRNPGRAEAPSIGMAGGTFLTERSALDEVGGYPDVTRAVDHHLKVRLRDRGLGTFRTHGFGFVLRRHAQGHTWDATDDALRAKAVRTFDGLPAFLQLGDTTRSAMLPPA